MPAPSPTHEVLHAQSRDVMDFHQGSLDFLRRVGRETAMEGREDTRFVRAAYTDDEGKSMFRAVAGIEVLKLGEFRRGEAVETDAALFLARTIAQVSGHGQASGQIRMREDQPELLFRRGRVHDLAHGGNQGIRRGKRPPLRHRRGHPGRILVNAAESRDKFTTVDPVDFLEKHGRVHFRI